MDNPDFVAIAKAYGFSGREVKTREELEEGVKEMFASKGCYLLVADVEEEGSVYPMVPAGGTVTNIMLGNDEQDY